jgi:hypothetical protein
MNGWSDYWGKKSSLIAFVDPENPPDEGPGGGGSGVHEDPIYDDPGHVCNEPNPPEWCLSYIIGENYYDSSLHKLKTAEEEEETKRLMLLVALVIGYMVIK